MIRRVALGVVGAALVLSTASACPPKSGPGTVETCRTNEPSAVVGQRTTISCKVNYDSGAWDWVILESNTPCQPTSRYPDCDYLR